MKEDKSYTAYPFSWGVFFAFMGVGVLLFVWIFGLLYLNEIHRRGGKEERKSLVEEEKEHVGEEEKKPLPNPLAVEGKLSKSSLAVGEKPLPNPLAGIIDRLNQLEFEADVNAHNWKMLKKELKNDTLKELRVQ